MKSASEMEHYQDVKLVRLVLASVFFMFLLTGVVFTYTPASMWEPQFVNHKFKQGVTTFFPQGWAFFTKPSSEPHLAVYTSDGDSLGKPPAGSAANKFGLSREGRSQGVELALIAQGIPESGWNECRSPDTDECLGEAAEAKGGQHRAQNPTPSPSICGEAIVVEKQMVPYHYRDFYQGRSMTNKWARVTAEC